jgi:hypothetical protein
VKKRPIGRSQDDPNTSAFLTYLTANLEGEMRGLTRKAPAAGAAKPAKAAVPAPTLNEGAVLPVSPKLIIGLSLAAIVIGSVLIWLASSGILRRDEAPANAAPTIQRPSRDLDVKIESPNSPPPRVRQDFGTPRHSLKAKSSATPVLQDD